MSVSLISIVTGAIVATAVIVALSLLTDFPERVVKLTQVELKPEPFSHTSDSSIGYNPPITQHPTSTEPARRWIWHYIGLPITVLGGVLLTIFFVEFAISSIQIPGLGSVQEQGLASPIGLFFGIFAFIAVLVIALFTRHTLPNESRI